MNPMSARNVHNIFFNIFLEITSKLFVTGRLRFGKKWKMDKIKRSIKNWPKNGPNGHFFCLIENLKWTTFFLYFPFFLIHSPSLPSRRSWPTLRSRRPKMDRSSARWSLSTSATRWTGQARCMLWGTGGQSDSSGFTGRKSKNIKKKPGRILANFSYSGYTGGKCEKTKRVLANFSSSRSTGGKK